jgi:hypothetical protein
MQKKMMTFAAAGVMGFGLAVSSSTVKPTTAMMPQAAPDPIVFNQTAQTDNLVVLMAAAAEYSRGLTVRNIGYPKHAYMDNFGIPSRCLKWQVSLATGAAYRVYARLSSSTTVPLKLSVEGTGTALNFTTRGIGWDRQDAGTINIPAGRSRLVLRPDASSTNAIPILSLELVRESDRAAYEQRVAAFRADTTWLSQSKYGLMTSYGAWGYPRKGGRKSLEDFANGFDVPAFVSKVKQTGASYLIWSLTWWEYRMMAPIPEVDAIVGNGNRTATRDVVGELAAALQKEGIRFMLYYHTGHDSHLKYKSTDWWRAQQWPDKLFSERGSGDRTVFFENWIKVITAVGLRYGKNLDGFFFDDALVYYPAPFERLGQAAKAGNPNRLIAYNTWVNGCTDFQETIFGENLYCEETFGCSPIGGNGIFVDGQYKGLLQHGMPRMEQGWGVCFPNQPIKTSMTASQAISWVQSASRRNVPIAFTMMFWEDQSYSQASMDVLVALKAAIYPPAKPAQPAKTADDHESAK